MGFLDTVVGGIFDFGGAMLSGWQNKKSAKTAREYYTAMSNSAHQREVADLKAAGLNPILSALGSGASTAYIPTQSAGPDFARAGGAVGERVGTMAAQIARSVVAKNEQDVATGRSQAELNRELGSEAVARAENQRQQAATEATQRTLNASLSALNSANQMLAEANRIRTYWETDRPKREAEFLRKLSEVVRNQGIALQMYGSSALGQAVAGSLAPSAAVQDVKTTWNWLDRSTQGLQRDFSEAWRQTKSASARAYERARSAADRAADAVKRGARKGNWARYLQYGGGPLAPGI